MAYDPLQLSDGTTINPKFVKDYDAGHSYDYDSGLQSAGYVPMTTQGTVDWYNQNLGTQFGTGNDYLNWVYGGGNAVTDQNGTQYFKTPNGIENTVNTPLSYEPQGMEFGDWVLAGMGTVAGLGLGGVLPGTESIFGAGAAGAGATGTGGSFGATNPWAAGSLAGEGIGTFGSVPTTFGWDSFLAGGGLAEGGLGGLGTLGGTIPGDIMAGAGASVGAGGSGMSSIWNDITNFFTPSPASAGSSALQYGAEEIDGSMQTIYDQMAAKGAPGYLPSLASNFASTQAPIDWVKLLGAGGNALLNYYQGQKAEDQMNSAADRADPFGSQRPFYQQQLAQSYTDPNFLQNNPVFQQLLSANNDEVKRRMAARGYNNSGNILHELQRTGMQTAANYMLPFQAQTGQFAGAGFSPTQAGFLQAQGAQMANQSNQQAAGNIGVLADILAPTVKNWFV